MLARIWHGVVAVLILVALVIQLVIAVHAAGAPLAHDVGTIAGTPITGRLVRVLSFFTIQSNVLCAVTSAQLAFNPARDGRLRRIARLDALFGITVTGVVYSTVLARIHEPNGWEQVSTNTIFHYAAPIMAVAGWVTFGPRARVDPHTLRWALAWPASWFLYTLAHGAITHWYPYPFVDVHSHGYLRVVINALLVTAVFGAIAALFSVGDRKLPARTPTRARTGAPPSGGQGAHDE
ncbi:MAG: Pr6Pr family membrane protein [Actinomycetota bacterium]|nr:Pr6Pr family membrane protein [Actinomycetota bacterium]